jgi:hypothetical protein
MRIENFKRAIKGFQVRIVDSEGHARLMLTYPNIQSARGAARAWTVAYATVRSKTKSGMKE